MLTKETFVTRLLHGRGATPPKTKDETMKNENKKWYAWVGQNASTGRPNEITGRMSMYGRNLVFRTKSDRDEFVDDFYNHSNPSEFAVKCSKKQLRSYNLGESVRDFEEHLTQLSYTSKDNYGFWTDYQ